MRRERSTHHRAESRVGGGNRRGQARRVECGGRRGCRSSGSKLAKVVCGRRLLVCWLGSSCGRHSILVVHSRHLQMQRRFLLSLSLNALHRGAYLVHGCLLLHRGPVLLLLLLVHRLGRCPRSSARIPTVGVARARGTPLSRVGRLPHHAWGGVVVVILLWIRHVRPPFRSSGQMQAQENGATEQRKESRKEM